MILFAVPASSPHRQYWSGKVNEWPGLLFQQLFSDDISLWPALTSASRLNNQRLGSGSGFISTPNILYSPWVAGDGCCSQVPADTRTTPPTPTPLHHSLPPKQTYSCLAALNHRACFVTIHPQTSGVLFWWVHACHMCTGPLWDGTTPHKHYMHKSMKNTPNHSHPAQHARTHSNVGSTAVLSKMCQVEKEKQQQLGLDTQKVSNGTERSAGASHLRWFQRCVTWGVDTV